MKSLRKTLVGLLKDKKFDEAVGLASKDRRTVRCLTGLLYHEDDLVRWRAVTVFGHMAAAMPEKVRPLVFHLLYSLSEESSVVGWNSAQAIGEIARRNPSLTKTAIRPVVHFLDDEEVSRPANRNTRQLVGTMWATGNVAATHPELAAEAAPGLERFLDDPDPDVRAHAAWALGRIAEASPGSVADTTGLKRLLGDTAATSLYEDDELVRLAVKDVAAGALDKIEKSG